MPLVWRQLIKDEMKPSINKTKPDEIMVSDVLLDLEKIARAQIEAIRGSEHLLRLKQLDEDVDALLSKYSIYHRI